MDDLLLYLNYFLRWGHIISGIIWIGLLYFFNFVNIPFQGTMDKDLKQKVNPQLMPRALFFFRWGAMSTFIFGLVLLITKYFGTDLWTDAVGAFSHRAMWILFGILLATIMWFNVWFVIWPSQKRLINWTKAGEAPPEMAAIAKKAATASRINTYLSAPMLFAMIAPNNLGMMTWQMLLATILIGLGVIKMLYTISKKVPTEV